MLKEKSMSKQEKYMDWDNMYLSRCYCSFFINFMLYP